MRASVNPRGACSARLDCVCAIRGPLGTPSHAAVRPNLLSHATTHTPLQPETKHEKLYYSSFPPCSLNWKSRLRLSAGGSGGSFMPGIM